MRHVGADQDKVEGKGPLLGPVLVCRDDGLLGPELLDVSGLVRAVREGIRLSAQRDAPLESEMA